ncbi:MAG: helix-turn-helix domain-containing protein [Frankiaceae bacterium]|nr:helix-turn-helix domain-containing protein [Frankiaceae bacterium]
MAGTSTSHRFRRATSRLTTDAVSRMATLPWFGGLPPEERSFVGLVVQAGLDEFASWLRDTSKPPHADPAIFSAAPRALARAVSLQQTVQLIRVAVEVLEAAIPTIATSDEEADALEHAVLRYSREVAFAAAEVYAAAAEERGAWDARTEASVVDALLRGDVGEAVLTRAGSLGWGRPEWATVLAGTMPGPDDARIPDLRAAARRTGLCLLVGEYGGRLIVVVGGSGPQALALEQAGSAFPPGPVVVGPTVSELAEVVSSIAEALAGLAAVPAWPDAPRPVPSSELLAERAVLGDDAARRRLRSEVYEPLRAAGGDLLLTAATYLEAGSAVESAARRLFLHPNTVRYRLRKIAAVTQRDLTAPRDAQVVRLALVVGRA